jgi:hypothetical protein
VGKLIGTPFGEEVVTDKDVVGSSVLYMKELGWSPEAKAFFEKNPDAVPAKIIGYFTTEYEGKILWGKVVEWKTKNGEILYISLINGDADYNHSHPGGQIFPIGFIAGDVDGVQPKNQIMEDKATNDLLQLWINQNSPPTDLENFILVGRTG